MTTNHLTDFDLLRAIPIPKESKIVGAAGRRISISGDGPIVALLRKYKKFLTYQAFIENPPGRSIANVTGTERVVGSIQRSNGGGHLILLPAPNFAVEFDEGDGPEEEEDRWLDEALDFQKDLIEAIASLSGARSDARPAWAARFDTKDSRRARDAVIKQEKAITAARNKLTKLQQEQEVVEARQQLYLGTGRSLELEVRSVLELLGGSVTEPEPGRDDWQVSFPEGTAVVEVKGVSKSAAEKHAAQLEKWVSGAFEESGVKPKGILIVNTWRELPLDERTGADFPDQMLPYCIGREHCLVTGLQLFVIRSEVERDPNQAAHWRKTLLQTSGKIDGCDDWRAVVEQAEATDN
ncbi:hypothetical protein GA0070558_103290 [Micromonospora haikouensis]|uniref:Uncharacterized protein n=1 Tax=Micromonospora haikouensis TaxID=686309 RepID=A0A1C4UJ04_9ACTN|nr:hypothetical protein [Micromonospora haikouensis]SCE71632.1 hypothetical protein GA0070558_103290 [Micromonospora haikouensis]